MSNIMNIDIELSGIDVGFIFKDFKKKKTPRTSVTLKFKSTHMDRFGEMTNKKNESTPELGSLGSLLSGK